MHPDANITTLAMAMAYVDEGRGAYTGGAQPKLTPGEGEAVLRLAVARACLDRPVLTCLLASAHLRQTCRPGAGAGCTALDGREGAGVKALAGVLAWAAAAH